MRPAASAIALALALPLALSATGCADPPAARAPSRELDAAAARRLLASLVDEERRRAGLGGVSWDEAAAVAAQSHADDMASRGFAAHIGTDGSVPEERYTRAGGAHAVMENVGCVADGAARALEGAPRFSRAEVEALHRAFMDEGGPAGLHRRNVLDPLHGGIGVGLARAEGVERACVAVLLAARDGTFAPLPREVTLGDSVEVAGTLPWPDGRLHVSVARLPARGRPTIAELLASGPYSPATPHAKVETRTDAAGGFRATVVLDDRRTPGTYEIGVWAEPPPASRPVLVGLRTVVVR